MQNLPEANFKQKFVANDSTETIAQNIKKKYICFCSTCLISNTGCQGSSYAECVSKDIYKKMQREDCEVNIIQALPK